MTACVIVPYRDQLNESIRPIGRIDKARDELAEVLVGRDARRRAGSAIPWRELTGQCAIRHNDRSDGRAREIDAAWAGLHKVRRAQLRHVGNQFRSIDEVGSPSYR